MKNHGMIIFLNIIHHVMPLVLYACTDIYMHKNMMQMTQLGKIGTKRKYVSEKLFIFKIELDTSKSTNV